MSQSDKEGRKRPRSFRRPAKSPVFMDSQPEEVLFFKFFKLFKKLNIGGESPTRGPELGIKNETRIWGTDIDVKTCMKHFELFIREYREPDAEDPKYLKVLEEIEDTQIYTMDLDCVDLNNFNPELYRQLVSYPQEILPLFDAVAQKEYSRLFPEDPSDLHIQVKTFNLLEKKKSRDIDPEDIDCLISFTAMVTRVSSIIPDTKQGFFRCSICRHETEVPIDRGRVLQPDICKNNACKTRDSYAIVHNRSGFADKQLVRVQETPESIPEGETPQTLDVFCYGELIDSVKPGDRLEVTGVYRAVPVRVNRLARNLKALYRSYIDAIHFKKVSNRVLSLGSERGGLPEAHSVSEYVASQRENEQRIRKLADCEDIYQKLVNSLGFYF